jgi:hypothetical protein
VEQDTAVLPNGRESEVAAVPDEFMEGGVADAAFGAFKTEGNKNVFLEFAGAGGPVLVQALIGVVEFELP